MATNLEVQPRAKHTHTIINLHGRGSSALEYRNDFEESQASDGRTLRDIFPGIKWVYPTAPQLYSERFKEEMSQWFDMAKTEDPNERSDEQTQDLVSSSAAMKQLVLDEGDEIGLQNVILCGISQGAAIAVTVLLGMERPLGGLIGFATWLPSYARSLALANGARKTPLFLGHCRDDDTVAVAHGSELKERLGWLGFEVVWEEYDTGGHWVHEPKGVDDTADFLARIIGRRQLLNE